MQKMVKERRQAASLARARAKLQLLLKGVQKLHTRDVVVGAISPSTVRWWADPKEHEDGPMEIVSARWGGVLAVCADGRWSLVTHGCAAHNVLVSQDCEPADTSPPKESQQQDLLYRAPEQLLHGGSGGQGADMWAVGCLFGAELRGGLPLFGAATSVLELLRLHCDCVGFSFEGDDFTVRSHFDSKDDEARGERPSLWTLLEGSHVCLHAFDLLSRLLAPSACARISADDALLHPFFSEQCAAGCLVSAARVAPAVPAIADMHKVVVHLSMLGAFESQRSTGCSCSGGEMSEERSGERSRASTMPPSPSSSTSTESISHDALAGLWALVRERRAKRVDQDEVPCRGPLPDSPNAKRPRCAERASGEPNGPWCGSVGVRLV
jgi:serine/threonine protein kinase